jgi:acyl carrier protein
MSISVQWGAWAGAGMAGNDASTRLRVERTGLGLVEVPSGLAALGGLLLASTSAPALAGAVPIRWARFLEKQFANSPPPMFAAFAGDAATASAAAGGNPAAAAGKAAAAAAPAAAAAGAGMSAADREQYMLQQVQEAVRSVLGGDISPDQPLMAAGLDSLSSVEFRNSLESKLGVDLPTTLVFDYPTMGAIVEFLAKKVQPAAGEGTEGQGEDGDAGFSNDTDVDMADGSAALVAAHHAQSRQLVVISGMAVRAGADAFGGIQPVDAIALVPASRWDLDSHEWLFGGLPVRFGTFLSGIAQFDAAALGVSDGEATLMDPQQRVLLEMVGELLLGDTAASRQGMGAFVGLSSTDYAKASFATCFLSARCALGGALLATLPACMTALGCSIITADMS